MTRMNKIALMITLALVLAASDCNAKSGPTRWAPCGGNCLITPTPSVAPVLVGPGWLWMRMMRDWFY